MMWTTDLKLWDILPKVASESRRYSQRFPSIELQPNRPNDEKGWIFEWKNKCEIFLSENIVVKISYKSSKRLFHQSWKSCQSICHFWLILLFLPRSAIWKGHHKQIGPFQDNRLDFKGVRIKVKVCLFQRKSAHPFPNKLFDWSHENQYMKTRGRVYEIPLNPSFFQNQHSIISHSLWNRSQVIEMKYIYTQQQSWISLSIHSAKLE